MIEKLTDFRSVITVGALSGVALLGAGCSHSSKAPAVTQVPTTASATHFRTIHCVGEHVNGWVPTPTNLNIATIAEALGVSQQDVADGALGPVTCAAGITAAQILSTKADVKGVGENCLMIGLQSPPESHKVYHEAIALCIAPIEITPVPVNSTTEA